MSEDSANAPFLKEVTRENTITPPGPGETLLLVQRHEEYDMNPRSSEAGKLTPEGAKRQRERVRQMILDIVAGVPKDEIDSIKFAVFASPTQFTGDGSNGGYRALETATITLEEIRSVMAELGLDESQLLNNEKRFERVQELLGQESVVKKGGAWGKGPIPSDKIAEPRIFEANPDFVAWLREKVAQDIQRRESQGETGLNPVKEFWKAYEEDQDDVRKKRLEMGAEGPLDMADRTGDFLKAMALFAERFHHHNPGKRLILPIVSHYDTLSPFIKSRIGNEAENMGMYLPVEHGAGLNIHIDKEGQTTAKINGMDYPLTITRPSDAQPLPQSS